MVTKRQGKEVEKAAARDEVARVRNHLALREVLSQLRVICVWVPSVLFLDEPTSGLDASSSLHLIKALRSIASQGLTVAAVLHQPRYGPLHNRSVAHPFLLAAFHSKFI